MLTNFMIRLAQVLPTLGIGSLEHTRVLPYWNISGYPMLQVVVSVAAHLVYSFNINYPLNSVVVAHWLSANLSWQARLVN
jgi:hypothetical protein